MMERQTARLRAWTISLASSLARGQMVFFVWVTLTEHKWVILAERRRSVVISSGRQPGGYV
jgi:hypothetical protein